MEIYMPTGSYVFTRPSKAEIMQKYKVPKCKIVTNVLDPKTSHQKHMGKARQSVGFD
jgi:hypothetical protein